MSFFHALQSLVFYVAACSPCHQTLHQRRLKKEARRQREAQQLEHAIPGGYNQPEPFKTNPYWSEEISMGPHLERKKYRNPSQRRLASSGGESVSVGGSSIAVNHTSNTITTTTTKSVSLTSHILVVTSGTDSTNSDTISRAKENEKPNASIGGVSVVTITNLDASSRRSESGYELSPVTTTDIPHDWNHRRYQREDEELWGSELSRTGHKLMDAIKHAGSSAGRFLESSLNKDARQLSDDEDEGSRYFLPVNPPVNDYHPPIVRRHDLKGTVRWMVQPPPPAKLMEGKVPVSRGSSIASRHTTASRRTATWDRSMDGGMPVSRGSSTSNLSRHPTHSNKVIDGVPVYGSSANDLSLYTTPEDDRKAEDTAVEIKL
ncbi:hypothetical protein F5B22DRAFT_659921 [Xylaria bambusicola]|uniref:uncharacterized protein n=1 Tax=Xylaria bambusicola TaxID=326684 RepID=UPI0020076B54|nr:uncharacterized protein F5B22DRAFT_659921 [Xylaria bambusicola]KAI0506861.1 hypothetical protein F5B22DRAFT_659921 [Xylaria bambusicola]